MISAGQLVLTSGRAISTSLYRRVSSRRYASSGSRARIFSHGSVETISGAVFLSLKNQRSARHQKQQSGDCLITARARLFMKPQAIGRVRDLVVILKVIHERCGFQIKGGWPRFFRSGTAAEWRSTCLVDLPASGCQTL